MEDYAANRKGPQPGGATAGTGIFGATSSTQQTQQQSGGFGLFGQSQQSQNKPSFGEGCSFLIKSSEWHMWWISF